MKSNSATPSYGYSILTYRILLILAFLLYPLFGLLYNYIQPDVIDPMWQRYALSIIPGGLFIFSFFTQKVKKNLYSSIITSVFIVSLHYLFLMYLNNFHLLYLSGLLVLTSAVSILFNRLRHFAAYFALMIIGAHISAVAAGIEVQLLFLTVASLATVGAVGYIIYRERFNLINMLEDKNEQLFVANKEITDSIYYASGIQRSILPDEDLKNKFICEHFVLYKPKGIVSGDFYWYSSFPETDVIACVDCTGHGVPGAFMSMVGNILLNDIINDKEILQPSKILALLDKEVKKVLRQKGLEKEAKDGMDLALCTISKSSSRLAFSGAYRPLYLIRNNELHEHKGSPYPIGGHLEEEKKFNEHTIEIEANDVVYIFSDGYADQFGGQSNKKYKTSNFKKFLLQIHQENASRQKELLEKEFESWKGKEEQVDDVLIVGIKF